MSVSLENCRTAILTALTNEVSDPETRNDASWILGEFPDNTTFIGWPLITVGHVVTEVYERSFGSGVSSRVLRPYSIVLMVYTKSGIVHEQLLDDVEAGIYSGEAALITAGMHDVSVVFGSGDVYDNEEDVYVTPVTIEFSG